MYACAVASELSAFPFARPIRMHHAQTIQARMHSGSPIMSQHIINAQREGNSSGHQPEEWPEGHEGSEGPEGPEEPDERDELEGPEETNDCDKLESVTESESE